MIGFSRRTCLSCLSILALAYFSAGIAQSAEEKISDDLLFDRVNHTLIVDPDLGIRPLEITVQDGKVTVTGFVATEKLRKRVDKVVKKVKGVREVDNQVQIRQ